MNSKQLTKYVFTIQLIHTENKYSCTNWGYKCTRGFETHFMPPDLCVRDVFKCW